MEFRSAGIEVIHAIPVPASLADILHLPNGIEIFARIQRGTIGGTHADHLTGIVIRTCSAAGTTASTAYRRKSGNDQ